MEHDDDRTQRRGVIIRKGSWMREEDVLLRKCIEKYGEGNWNQVPLRAGLNRCRKSCRLRWLNYLKPNIKQGEFAMDEVDLIIKMHKLLGNKWSLIAGRLPGRTANGVKNYWNTHLKQKQRPAGMMKDINKVVDVDKKINITSRNADERKVVVVRPQPRSFSENSKWIKRKSVIHRSSTNHEALPEFLTDEALTSWWQENIDLFDDDHGRRKKRKRSVLRAENAVGSSAGCCCRCRCRCYKSSDQSTTTSIDEDQYQELCVDDYLSEQQRFHVDKKRNISDIVGDESQLLQSDDFDDLINLF